jgi:hypothetical protein
MCALRKELLMFFNYRVRYHVCSFLNFPLEYMGPSASLQLKAPKISSTENFAIHVILCKIDFSLLFLPYFSAMLDHLYIKKTEISQMLL